MKNAVLMSKVEGTTTIISIVPEGTGVNVGDLVCELDSSALTDKLTQQEITVENAKAALEKAQGDLKIQEAQNESDIEAAKLKLKLAQIDLKKYQEGDLVQEKNDLDSQIKLAEENLARAQESYTYVARLAKNGYRTQNDLEAERIAVATSKINLELVQGSKRVLIDFTEERTFAELDANVKEYGLQIQRTQNTANSALAQKKAALRAAELTFEVESKKHDRLAEQIKSCKIYANQDGQVVYANIKDGRPTEQVMIEVGVGVRERQAIINLPDLDLMKVNARIHESRISMVRPGMTVTVKVDAFSDQTFHGIVDTVASVPSSTGGFGNTVKEYDAVVKLIDETERVNKLRPGLNASIEVLVERRENVLQIPLQANVTIGGKQFVFVVTGKKVEMRSIKVGKTNANFIEVLEGIKEGEEVVMNPHSRFTKEISDKEAEIAETQAKEVAKQPEVTAPPPGQPGQGGPGAPGAPAGSQGGPGGGTGRRPEGAPGAGGPAGEGRPSGPPSEGGGGRGNFDPMAFFDRMDQDQDGKISKDEAMGPFKENFEAVDTDSDGKVSKDEFMAARGKFGRGGRGGGGGRPPGDSGGGN